MRSEDNNRLIQASNDYLAGRISRDDYLAIRIRCSPDYDAIFDGVARAQVWTQIRQIIRRVFTIANRRNV